MHTGESSETQGGTPDTQSLKYGELAKLPGRLCQVSDQAIFTTAAETAVTVWPAASCVRFVLVSNELRSTQSYDFCDNRAVTRALNKLDFRKTLQCHVVSTLLPVLSSALHHTAAYEDEKALRESFGMRSILCGPIVLAGQGHGVVLLAASLTDFTASDVELLEAFASMLAPYTAVIQANNVLNAHKAVLHALLPTRAVEIVSQGAARTQQPKNPDAST